MRTWTSSSARWITITLKPWQGKAEDVRYRDLAERLKRKPAEKVPVEHNS